MSDVILKNYTTYRVTLTLASTEYSQLLSTGTLKVTISSDDLSSQILFSMTAGISGIGTRIFQGAQWTPPGFILGGQTIYMQSPNAGTICVIETWDKS